MNYKEFCEYIKENVKDFLPEEFQDGEVTLHTTLKNNNVMRQGLMIKRPEVDVVPVLYLEEFYEEYNEENSARFICNVVAEKYQEVSEKATITEVNFTDYDKVKDRLMPVVINWKDNRRNLENRPHQRMDDLAISYIVDVEKLENAYGTTAVTNNLMELWDVTKEEVHDQAITNMREKYPVELSRVDSILMGTSVNYLEEGVLESGEKASGMLVLKNSRETHGAAVLADPEILEQVAKAVDDDYVILPSSIHEVLVLSKSELEAMGVTAKDLGRMVREVNSQEVDKEDRLSDHVYQYSREERKLETIKESLDRGRDMER